MPLGVSRRTHRWLGWSGWTLVALLAVAYFLGIRESSVADIIQYTCLGLGLLGIVMVTVWVVLPPHRSRRSRLARLRRTLNTREVDRWLAIQRRKQRHQRSMKTRRGPRWMMPSMFHRGRVVQPKD